MCYPCLFVPERHVAKGSTCVMQQGVMTKRILGLLWRISLASQVPTPLDMTLCFADVLRDYALTSKSADTRELALEYVSHLVEQLEGTEKALPAMRVLSHLIANSGNHTVSVLSSIHILIGEPCFNQSHL